MGAQASAIDASVADESGTRDHEQQAQHGRNVVLEETTTIETVSMRAEQSKSPPPSTAPPEQPARPPVAPPRAASAKGTININADRVVSVRGTIKRAYPLQILTNDDAGSSEGDVFGIGTGPCGRDATHVVAWEVQMQNVSSFATCFVFLYNQWAQAASDFQRLYRVDISGSGLVAIDHWDIGHDTEDVKRCYVVAEPLVLKKTMERSPRLLPKAQGVTIELAYEEPLRVPESDQVKYLERTVLHARDLYSSGMSTNTVKQLMEKANPRGKRMLKQISTTADAATAITTPSSYIYTPIAELNPGNANLYGVVVNISLPKRSERGTDYYMAVQVVDESSPKREDSLQIMVFLPALDLMPRILHVGDVVRFHKIAIKRYHDRLQGVSSSKATRYLVLRRGANDSIEQQTTSANWTFEKYDRERFHQLADWADRALRVDVTLPPGCPQPSRLLGDMQYAELFVDVVVRVLFVQAPYGTFTAARLIIWDGSGDAATCGDLYAKLRREKAARPNAVPFIPASGLLMEIVVDSCWAVMETLGFRASLTNHWCRFRNLAVASEQSHPQAQGGMRQWYELHFREVSSLMFVPDTTADVQIREACTLEDGGGSSDLRVEERAHEVEKAARVPSTAPAVALRVETTVPSFILDRVPVASLHTVLTSIHVPRKYHCHARVVALWPKDIEQIVKQASPGKFVYSFVMRLQDSSGDLDVIVHGDDADKFLHGIPPCDLSTSTSSRALLEKRFATLLASAEPLHYCVKSYRTKDAAGNVRFRLFDTVLHLQQ